MATKDVTVGIGGGALKLSVEGDTFYGPDEVLLLQDDNLIAGTPWLGEGYTIEPFFDEAVSAELKDGALRLLGELVETALGDAQGLTLEGYHKLVDTDEKHAKVIALLKEGFPIERFPLPLETLEERVSEVCGVEVAAFNPKLPDQRFYLRIVRPGGKNDNNPPHRDVWLDYYRDCVNIYVPICGSDENSSLPLIPGSHLWKESDIQRTVGGAKIQGYTYRVPSVSGASKPLDFVRPNPGAGEFMVFSPYLIHGGGVNWNPDTTRMSLEMRFFRKR